VTPASVVVKKKKNPYRKEKYFLKRETHGISTVGLTFTERMGPTQNRTEGRRVTLREMGFNENRDEVLNATEISA